MPTLTVLLDDRFVAEFAGEVVRTGEALISFPPYRRDQSYASALATARHPRLITRGIQVCCTVALARQGLLRAQTFLSHHPTWDEASSQAARVLRSVTVPIPTATTASTGTGTWLLAHAIELMCPDVVVSDHRGELRVTVPPGQSGPVAVSPHEWIRIAARLAR